MARKIETISLDEVLCYDETVGGVTTTVRYLPLRKDADGVVLLRDEVLDGRRINAANDATYIGSEMDTWLNDADAGYLSRFDAKMRAAIIPTTIKVKPPDADAVQEIARSVYLLSESEVGSGSAAEGDSMLDALKAHKSTTDANKARIATNSAGSASYWWLRSAGSASQVRSVYSSGNVYSGSASGSYCPRPAFKVANATMVSDGAEDTIYILPDSGRLYREMQFTAYCGQTDKRPKKARVQIEITNAVAYDMYVSNNAKDANPTWVECAPDQVVTLGNTAKETDKWEIGVKVYAQSGGRATCGEPVVIVETEV